MKASFDSPDPLYQESLLEEDLKWVDRICDRFARDWNTGRDTRIEDYLRDATGMQRDVLLRELVLTEMALRKACGQTLTPAAYQQRFAADWSLLTDLFNGHALTQDRAHVESSTETQLTWRRSRTTAQRERRLPSAQDANAVHPNWPELPGYEILGELGRGGMGVVYKARDLRLNRLVALKVILAGEFACVFTISRFRGEAEAAAHLHHIGIVQVYDVGCHKGRHFFTQEFVDGSTLAEFTGHKPLPNRLAVQLVEAMARAIHYAHQRGVVHRDLKPANVLLATATAGGLDDSISAQVVPSPTGTLVFGGKDRGGMGENVRLAPKITDFGLAKRLDTDHQHTITGAVMGSVSYMAPEQAAGEVREVGPLADVYSLGAILYFLLTGRPPLQAATPIETLMLVRDEQPVSPRQLQPKLPADVDTICLKCLEKSPSKRYETAEALADDLHRFLDGKPIVARPIGVAERTWRLCRRKPVMACLIAFTIASLAFDFLAVSWRWQYANRAYTELLQSRAEIVQQRDALLKGHAALVLQRQRELAEAAPLALDDWHRYALLQLKLGDDAGYRRTCHGLVGKFEGMDVDPNVAGAVGWLCAIGPCSVEDAEAALMLVQRSGSAEPRTSSSSSRGAASASSPQALRTILAGLLYRAKRFDEVIEHLRESTPTDSRDHNDFTQLFLAMSQYELGQIGSVKDCLNNRSVQIDDTDSQQRLEIEILRSQALALISNQPSFQRLDVAAETKASK